MAQKKKPKLTLGERARIAGLEFQSFRRGAAGLESPRIDARQEAIRKAAAKRATGK